MDKRRFQEQDLWIKTEVSTPLVEHFTEDEYEKIQKTLYALKEKQLQLHSEIQDREKYVSTMEDKYNQYQTFYHMFENTEERNQSYHKMIFFLVTLLFLLLLFILFYFLKKI